MSWWYQSINQKHRRKDLSLALQQLIIVLDINWLSQKPAIRLV